MASRSPRRSTRSGLAEQLEDRGVDVKYAIHGRRAHARAHERALAEANVPYPQLREMEDINPEFDRADVALVIGANDVNPAARRPGARCRGCRSSTWTTRSRSS